MIVLVYQSICCQCGLGLSPVSPSSLRVFFYKYSKKKKNGKISAQPHTTLCIQFLDRENNDKNNRLPLGKQICFKIVWGCVEILPQLHRYRSYIVTDR